MSESGTMDNHPIDYLFERMEQVAPYPAGVVPVPCRIAGTAFFPGGAGLWQSGLELPTMPTGGVMVLGHNFDTLAGFERSLTHAGENLRGETWRNLLSLLDLSGISRKCCFFTNVYMGLIDGPSAIGTFPGARDPAFVSRCVPFLAEQIRVMQPRLVLTLGKEVVPVLAELSDDLASWRKVLSLRKLDQRSGALAYPVAFAGVSHPVAVAALTHPALRHLNVPHRRYKGMVGEEAELVLISDALRVSGVSKVEGENAHMVPHVSSGPDGSTCNHPSESNIEPGLGTAGMNSVSK
jgi:uracil-DNA glycosylase family 4